jgi:hypothetical protein
VIEVVGMPVVLEVVEAPLGELGCVVFGEAEFPEAFVGFVVLEFLPATIGGIGGATAKAGVGGDPRRGVDAGF